MTYDEFSSADVISAIEKTLPSPENPFENAMYFQNLKWVVKELDIFYTKEYNDLIEELKNEESDEYCLKPVIKRTSAVNRRKLKELLPEIYKRVAFVKSNIAEKVLSRTKLHELCKDVVGDDIFDYETVNKGDLEDNLPPEYLGNFIEFSEDVVGYTVQVKE